MGDVTEDDIGKSIFTAEEHRIGTLRRINGPTLLISIADDVDPSLRSDIGIAEKTAIKDNEGHLAGAARAWVAEVTEDEIYFWPTYAAEAEHESVSYDEIPEEESHEDPTEF